MQIISSFNPAKILAKELKVHYLSYACWSLLRVGNQHYTMYSTHGSSGAKLLWTKVKAVMDVARTFDADITAYAHTHAKFCNPFIRQGVNIRNRTVEPRKRLALLTGSYLEYDDTYAQMAGYEPGQLGSPKVQLYADRFDMHESM